MGGERGGARLLLVEDDAELSGMLVELLADEGYAVDAVHDGQSALHRALSREYEVAVFDRGLPHVEGLELLTRLRRAGWATPVLVLSAYGAARDRVAGLDAGAEDYLGKPFDVEELLARLRALLRRHLDTAETLLVPGGRLDPHARTVSPPPSEFGTAAGRTELSARESALLTVLAGRPTQVFSREELLDRVFSDAEVPNVVDTYVSYLRRKLGRNVIRTVHGVGYQLGRIPRPDRAHE
jgi:two-component system, OmpR family, response regulator QseB